MLKLIWKAFVITAAMTLLTGVVYPLAVTGLAQAIFHSKANGSIIFRNGTPAGSALIGQRFAGPEYFHTRPSAAGAKGYDPAASSGTNLGPTNKKLLESISERVNTIRLENGLNNEAIPDDLVMSSASGLDPQISPEAAFIQAQRVARARRMTLQEVRQLINRHIEGPDLGMLGEPRVNVLLLNLDLDKQNK